MNTSNTTSTSTFIKATSIPPSGRSGRWVPSNPSASSNTEGSGSLTASWCSASLELLFSGHKLVMAVGQKTARRAKPNGGTQMVAVMCGVNRRDVVRDVGSGGWRTLDLEAGSEVVILGWDIKKLHHRTFVKIVVVDWASEVEIEGFFVNEGGCIEPVSSEQISTQEEIPKILVIGDSISAGYAVSTDQGGEKVPFGCLNTFPFVAQRTLLSREIPRDIELDMIAYPGLCLVYPTEEEMERGFHPGMVEAFFWESIWNNHRLPGIEIELSPSVVIIQLGNNDQSFMISPERYRDALIKLIEELQPLSGGTIRHVWVVPPFPDADVPDYKEINKALAIPSQLTVLNEKFDNKITWRICDLAEGLTVEDTVDGVHPTLRVHEEIGRKLAVFIERELF